MRARATALVMTIALLTACATPTPQPRPDYRAYCADLRTDLPATDPMFQLKGRVTTFGFDRYTHEIAQFGKKGVYYEYFVQASATNGANCGYFPFYQMARAEYQPNSRTYVITLKNNKTFETRTNIPFHYRGPDSRNVFTALVDGMDETLGLWFTYMVNDPRFSEPREVNTRPTKISLLEIL